MSKILKMWQNDSGSEEGSPTYQKIFDKRKDKKMTSKAVRTERDRIFEKIRKHELEIKLLRTRLHDLREHCKHPRGRTLCSMGEAEFSCPDCG